MMPAASASRAAHKLEQSVFVQEAVAAAAALRATDRLGVLRRLARAPATPLGLALDCSLSEWSARIILSTLAALRVIEATSDGSYYATTHLSQLESRTRTWEILPDALREHLPTGDYGAEGPCANELAHLAIWHAIAGEVAAEHLRAQVGPEVLEVAAGTPACSIELAKRDAKRRVTIIGVSTGMGCAHRSADIAGHQSQFRYIQGDVLSLELGSAKYDLVIVDNVCRPLDEATSRRLLRRLIAPLRRGGKLAILDAVPNERLDGPPTVLLYALGLLCKTAGGVLYPFSTYVGWLRDAGYEAVERVELSAATPFSLVTAHRPAPADR